MIYQLEHVCGGVVIVGHGAVHHLEREIQHRRQQVVEQHPHVRLGAKGRLEFGNEGLVAGFVHCGGILPKIGGIIILNECAAFGPVAQQKPPHRRKVQPAAGLVLRLRHVHDRDVLHRPGDKLLVQRIEGLDQQVVFVGKVPVYVPFVDARSGHDGFGGGFVQTLGGHNLNGLGDQGALYIRMLQTIRPFPKKLVFTTFSAKKTADILRRPRITIYTGIYHTTFSGKRQGVF